MARGGGGDITGNGPGQGFTSPSTFTHVQGVSGAPTAADGGAADSRPSCRTTPLGTAIRVFRTIFCVGGTQWVSMSAANAKNRVKNAYGGPERGRVVAPLASQRFWWVLTHLHLQHAL